MKERFGDVTICQLSLMGPTFALACPEALDAALAQTAKENMFADN